MHGRRVVLHAFIQRFRCRDCGATFYEDPPDLSEKRHATQRFVDYVGPETLKRTFVSVATEVGVDEKTIRNIFKDYIAELEASTHFETPEWLGIDEVHLIHGAQCVIGNLKTHTIIEMLKKRTEDSVLKYLRKLPNRERIQLVCMDMWNPYRQVMKEVVPHAVVVVDKFHVLSMASDALETVRKSLKAELPAVQRKTLKHDRFILLRREADLRPDQKLILETWLANYPQLKAAYTLKESFYAIWDNHNRADAIKAYAEWQKQVTEDVQPAFKPLLTAMNNWNTEIFAYFDYRVTNAYTEALNGLIKIANRNGRGYSFDVIRAKMLYTNGFHKTQQRLRLSDNLQGYAMSLSIDHSLNFGADISTLSRQIQSGGFSPFSIKQSG